MATLSDLTTPLENEASVRRPDVGHETGHEVLIYAPVIVSELISLIGRLESP